MDVGIDHHQHKVVDPFVFVEATKSALNLCDQCTLFDKSVG